jgi:hypothetical protein
MQQRPPFWTAWQECAQEYVDSSAKVETADVDTIRRMFTTHVRADRFCEGHLASMFAKGHVVRLLRRLKAIRDRMPD